MTARFAFARLLGALCLALVLLLPAGAGAQSAGDVETARDLFRKALALSKEKKWQEAIELYERSLELKEAPITLYSLGVAYKEMGQYAEALESLRQFLAKPLTGGTEQFEQPARAAVAELEPKVAHVTIHVVPADAEGLTVLIDDKPIAQAAIGLPRLVNPGKRTFRARAEGYRAAAVVREFGEGESAEISLELTPLPKALPKPEEVAPAPEAPVPVEESSFPVGPVVLMAVGAAALGAGVAVGLIGYMRAKDAPTQDGSEAEDAKRLSLIGDIVAGAGGAIGAAGLIWLIVHVVGDGEADAAALAPGGAGLTFRF